MAENLNIVDFFTLFGPHPSKGAMTPSGTGPLLTAMGHHSVSSAVTLSTRAVYFDAAEGNRETKQAVTESGGKLIPAALLDPRRPNPERTGGGARVLVLLPGMQRYPLPYTPLTELLRTLAQLGGAAAAAIPIWWETSRPGDATAVLQTLRETNYPAPILLGGVSGDNLMEALAVAKVLPDRIHVATNGLRGIGEVGQAVAALGAEKVIFASGAPNRSLGAALAFISQAALSPEDRALVLGGNARRLFGARAESGAAV
ncbi:MAG: amidohydrolase family protein [Armatimonadota bacterium]